MDDLSRIFNAFDPLEPASIDYYTPTGNVRGRAGSVTRDFVKCVRLSRDRFVRFAFSGHIGCGKSSELHHLRNEMLAGGTDVSCFPVLIDTSDYLDDYDADATDLLLVIVAEIAAAVRDELHIELRDNYFERKLNELKSAFLSEVEMNEATIELPAVKAKLTRLRKDKAARDQVRQAIAAQVIAVLDEMNVLLGRVRSELTSKSGGRFSDLVLLIDNLEKIHKVSGIEEGLPSFRHLFLEQAPKLTGFDAHVVYTLPLNLVRALEGAQLFQRYERVAVLPMVKVETREGEPHAEGIELMRHLVGRRVAPTPLGGAIEPDALDYLLRYCGGHPRHLVQFMRFAAPDADALPIPLGSARAAVADLALTFSVGIPDKHWPLLARLHLSADRRIPNGDPDYLALLESNAILEYINGETDGRFSEPWYAVHPVVRELQKFKEAVVASEAG